VSFNELISNNSGKKIRQYFANFRQNKILEEAEIYQYQSNKTKKVIREQVIGVTSFFSV
jgi:hypothetical protein